MIVTKKLCWEIKSLSLDYLNYFSLDNYLSYRKVVPLHALIYPENSLKGTVSVISSDPLCKDANVWFTTVPLKALSDQVWNIYQCFVPVYFHLRFLYESDLLISCLLEAMEKLTEINIWVRKTTDSSTFLVRLWFQGYRCKSDIVIFAWRVT